MGQRPGMSPERPLAKGQGLGGLGDFNAERYPQSEMFRALYRQIARFLNWINGTGSGSSASAAVKEAETHRRDVENRSGSNWGGDWGA